MPPIVVHLFTGLAAAAFLSRYTTERRELFWGMAFGSVFPDMDLIVSSLAYPFTSYETGEFIHRTLTHSLLFIALIALFAVLVDKGFIKVLQGKALLLCAFGAGVLLHVALDPFYLVGVKFLFPFSMREFVLTPWPMDAMSDATKNIVQGSDFASETITYLFVHFAAIRLGTESRFTRLLLPLALINLGIYVTLTLLYFHLPYSEFIVLVYIPGIFFIAISTLCVPLLARGTFGAIGERSV